MRKLIDCLFLFLLLVASMHTVWARALSLNPKTLNVDNDSLLEGQVRWKKVKLENLSLRIPSELKQVKVANCIDGGCYEFRSEDLVLEFDSNN